MLVQNSDGGWGLKVYALDQRGPARACWWAARLLTPQHQQGRKGQTTKNAYQEWWIWDRWTREDQRKLVGGLPAC